MPESMATRTLVPSPEGPPSEVAPPGTTVERGQPPLAQSLPPLPRAFGRYELRALLGRGGMGTVYLAHDPQLDRLVALKIPRPVGDNEGEWRRRFQAEARTAATLQHPNICPVFEVGEVDAHPYLTMAYIEGESLAARLNRLKTLPIPEAVALVRTLAHAVNEAHNRGIIHRDLKPSNVMIDRHGQPVVMDFGLALRAAEGDDLRLTLSGVAVGTPAYMPPEQAGGDSAAIGRPTDVYALAVILYELATGQVPFQARTFGKLVAQIERDPPPRPSSLNANVDPALEAILLTALEKEPSRRFPTAVALAEALGAYLRDERDALLASYGAAVERAVKATGSYRGPAATPRRRRTAVAAAIALVLVATLAAVFYVQTDYGDLVIELSDPAAKVDVRVNGQELILDPNGNPIRLRAGKGQKLEVSGRDFETTSESFDLKRGGATVVRVTLRPKGGIAQDADPPKKDPHRPDDSPKRKPPKPVAYPARSTVIELPGWQILTDASRSETEKWLDERKKAKHSVTFLDVIAVDDKPLYCAVAALDDRQPNWVALLDLAAADMTPVPKLDVRVSTVSHWIVSISSYLRGENDVRVALLLHPGVKRWTAQAQEPEALVESGINEGKAALAPVRLLRAFSVGEKRPRYSFYLEVVLRGSSAQRYGMSAQDLTGWLEEQRNKDFMPVALSAVGLKDTFEFTAVCEPNKQKLQWQVTQGLTAQQLKEKAVALAPARFRPACVTAYAWDGAVRYCVVWVKEPPKPVEYPKEPTLVEMPGWQILTDATRDQMQKWLDDRKKAKHSVVWLDSYPIGDKPVFCAVAALNDRTPDWGATLEMATSEFNPGKAVTKLADWKTNRFVAISGYARGQDLYCALLWSPGRVDKTWVAPDSPVYHFTEEMEKFGKSGYIVRLLRPFPVGRHPLVAHFVEFAADDSTYTWQTPAEDLRKFLDTARSEDRRLTSIAAYVREGKVEFAAVAGPNRDGWDWQVDTDLPAPQLKARAATMAEKGFRPSCVTAYGWDGAVRYCAVWVKEPTPKK